MTRETSPFDLIFAEPFDQVSLFQQGGSIASLVRRIVEAYGLRNAAYLAVNLPGAAPRSPYIAATYSDEWVAHYRANAYHHYDPVVLRGFDSLLPLDWSQLDKTAPRVKRFFGEAREHGVGRHGLVFPIRGRHGERGIFTVATDEPDQAWLNIRKHLARDFQIISQHVHRLVLATHVIEPCPVRLSPREAECLTWAAAGKTRAQIAKILGLTERTALFYLETARNKLDALNTTQAVAKAISMNLITMGM